MKLMRVSVSSVSNFFGTLLQYYYEMYCSNDVGLLYYKYNLKLPKYWDRSEKLYASIAKHGTEKN